MCSRKKKDDDTDEDKEKKHQSKMDAKFFSFTTFFYAVGKIMQSNSWSFLVVYLGHTHGITVRGFL